MYIFYNLGLRYTSNMHLNLVTLLQTIGYIGLFAFVFAESGLFFGFFLPGDSLIFTAGLLASQHYFSLTIILIIVGVAAILGDTVGYWFGNYFGTKLYSRPDSRFFKKRHVEQAQEFYNQHGSKTIVLARFVPVVRTFAPIVAGASQMNYRKFFWYNAIGGIVWTLLLVILGYFLGRSIPNIDHYILPIVIIIVIVSLVPIAWKMVRGGRI